MFSEHHKKKRKTNAMFKEPPLTAQVLRPVIHLGSYDNKNDLRTPNTKQYIRLNGLNVIKSNFIQFVYLKLLN